LTDELRDGANFSTDLDQSPEPDDLTEEIIENLEASLNSFRDVFAGLATG
jgi:type I restriction enzyme M protein